MKRFIFYICNYSILLTSCLVLIGLTVPYNKDGFMREQFVKNKMLADTKRTSSIVLLGGSNVAFGYKSNTITDSLNIPVINAGLHAGIGLKFILDNCERYLRKNDILVISPEYSHFFKKDAYGNQPLTDIFYLSMKDSYRLMDINQLWNILNYTPAFLKSKIEYFLVNALYPSYPTIYRMSAFNSYGDVVAHWQNTNIRFSTKSSVQELRSQENTDYMKRFFSQLKSLKEKGVKIIAYPPAISETSYHNLNIDIEWIEQEFKANGTPFACPPYSVSFADSLFYDTAYHLNEQGAELHSLHLINIIKQNLSDISFCISP